MWPSLVALAGCVALSIAVAFDAGGYFPTSFVPAAAVAFAILGVLLAVRLPYWRPSTDSLIAVGALAALTAWTGLSATWAPDPSEAVIAFERAVFYLGFFALALLAAGSGRPARLVLWGALTVAVVVVGAGLLSRLFPELIDDGLRASEFQDFRLSYPLGYWNAFGAAAALGAILAVGMAADPRGAPAARALTCGLAVLFATAMYFSLSRGGWLALGLGIVALLLLGAHRASVLTTLVIAGVATAGCVLRLRGYDALVDDPAAGAGQESEGRAFAGWLLALAGLAALAQGVVAGSARSVPMRDLGRRLRRSAPYVAAGGFLVLVCVYLALATQIEGGAAGALRDSSDWVERQWDDFMAPASFSASGTARLTTARGSRSDLWRVAFDGFESDPLRGDGAGAFQIRWTRERDVDEDARDAHSLGFETLGELGLVGGLLLLAFLGAVVRAAIRARSRPGGLRRSEAAAAGAAAVVWVGHSMVDWDWQLPGLTCIALLTAAPLFPEGRALRRRGVSSSGAERSTPSRRSEWPS
jgi:O-antigen ligase